MNTPETDSPSSSVEKSKVVARVEESFYTKIFKYLDRFMSYWSSDQSNANEINVSDNEILERMDDQPETGSTSTGSTSTLGLFVYFVCLFT